LNIIQNKHTIKYPTTYKKQQRYLFSSLLVKYMIFTNFKKIKKIKRKKKRKKEKEKEKGKGKKRKRKRWNGMQLVACLGIEGKRK
jgi:large-conductance mechanosensitive channel